MLPCIKERPESDLEEMHQDRPARDANQHPRRRPEAPFKHCRPPLHPANAGGHADRLDRHAKRHQAPGDEKFREHRRSGEIAWLLAGDGCGSQFPHALAIVADPAVGGEFAHPRGVEDRLAGAGVRVAPSRAVLGDARVFFEANRMLMERVRPEVVVDFCYGDAVGGEIERGEIRGVHRW